MTVNILTAVFSKVSLMPVIGAVKPIHLCNDCEYELKYITIVPGAGTYPVLCAYS